MNTTHIRTALCCGWLALACSAQSSVRGWVLGYFDSEAAQGDCIGIDAHYQHTSYLRSDGRAFIAGNNWDGICTIPDLPSGQNYLTVASGDSYGVGLVSDGYIEVWGDHWLTPPAAPTLPPGMTYTQVANGGIHIAALRSDGSIIAWAASPGALFYGQLNVPPIPPNVSVLKVDVGAAHSLALLSDGSIIGWGSNLYGETSIPPLPPGVSYVDFDAGERTCGSRR